MGWRVLGVLALSACSQVFGLDDPTRRMTDAPTVMTDGTPIDAPLPETWSTAIEITELTSVEGADDPSLTDDQLQIFFGSTRPGGMGFEDIWMATRDAPSLPWKTPTVVAELNTVASETTARVTGDGLKIFFASNRLATTLDIWYSTRATTTATWSSPVRIAELSSANSDVSAASRDGRRQLIMVTGATSAQETLFTSTRQDIDDPWSTPARVVELDEGTSERDPWEPTARAVYYTRDDPNDGTTDIFVSRRAQPDQPFGAPVRLNGVNMPGINERDPWVSADERLLVFSSDRSGVSSRLYYSTRLD